MSENKKGEWEFGWVVEDITEKDAEAIADAFIDAVEKVKGRAGGGWHKLIERICNKCDGIGKVKE